MRSSKFGSLALPTTASSSACAFFCDSGYNAIAKKKVRRDDDVLERGSVRTEDIIESQTNRIGTSCTQWLVIDAIGFQEHLPRAAVAHVSLIISSSSNLLFDSAFMRSLAMHSFNELLS